MIPFGDIGSYVESALGGPITGVRFAASTKVEGDWVSGAETPLSFTASVQPSTPRDVRNIPEGERGSAAVTIYSSFRLRESSVDGQYQGDEINWEGYRWRVVLTEPWAAQANYTKAIAVRIGE